MWELDFVKPPECRSLYIECPMELYGQHLTKTLGSKTTLYTLYSQGTDFIARLLREKGYIYHL
jgi:hypothetical protein